MKPLNKRSPVSPVVIDHLKKTSDEKLIPEDQWQSIKKAADQKKEEE